MNLQGSFNIEQKTVVEEEKNKTVKVINRVMELNSKSLSVTLSVNVLDIVVKWQGVTDCTKNHYITMLAIIYLTFKYMES